MNFVIKVDVLRDGKKVTNTNWNLLHWKSIGKTIIAYPTQSPIFPGFFSFPKH